MKMSKKELIDKLQKLADEDLPGGSEEDNHMEADALLLEYIDDEKVTEVFEAIKNGMHNMSGQYTWNLQYKNLWRDYLKRRCPEIVKGLKRMNMEKPKVSFKEEMDDLQKVYESGMQECREQMNSDLPYLICRMEEYCKLYRQFREKEEKLENLKEKRISNGE
jgi:hypothetical protein